MPNRTSAQWLLVIAAAACSAEPRPRGQTPASADATSEPSVPGPAGARDPEPPVGVVTLPPCTPSARVVINELVSSNVDGLVDASGLTSDWIELYNPAGTAVALEGWGLSDDGGDPFRWTFPPVELRPGAHLLLFASGTDHRGVVAAWDTRVDWGDSWRYRPVSAPVDADWMQPGYDDSGWDSGPSGFGRGDDDDATPVTSHTFYVRTDVHIAPGEHAELTGLLLHVDHDDAFVAYLNGTEVARANIGTPGVPPAWDDWADTETEAVLYAGGTPAGWDLTWALPMVVEGDNVLAIELHDAAAGWIDSTLIPFVSLGFGPGHQAVVSPSPHIDLPQTLLSADFVLRAEGEALRLTDPSGCRSDTASPGQLYADMSYGRQPDGTGPFGFFMEPTPGEPNLTPWRPGFAETPSFDRAPGYASPGDVTEVSVSDPDAVVRFAIGGPEPTEADPVADGPIAMVGDEAMVLRARAWQEGLWPSRIATASWIFGPPSTLPLVTLTTDPPNLWDPDTGIYVLGDDFQPGVPYFGANFWQDWERPIHASLWEPDGTVTFAVDVGVKIHGGWSRANDQKSLRLIARAGYGAPAIEGPLFPELPVTSFRTLILRAAGNDWYGCNPTGCSNGAHLRDRLMHGFTRGSDMDAMAGRPVVVYLNGAYWGIHNLRERPDAHYVASHHGATDIDLLELRGVPVVGEAGHYLETLDILRALDLSDPDAYAEARARIEVKQYATYQAFQIFWDNTDWPGNNIKFWRPRTPEGRWRWLLYDTDFGLGRWGASPANDTLDFALDPQGGDWPNPPWSTELFRLLMTSDRFERLFVNTYADLLNTVLTPEVTRATLAAAEAELLPAWDRHHVRWGHYPDPVPAIELGPDAWANEIAWIDSWLALRPAYARGDITQTFGAPPWTLTLDASPPGACTFQLTAVEVSPPFSGTYFQGIEVRVTAVPGEGYAFVGWSDPDLPQEPTVRLDLQAHTDLIALLE